MAVLEIAILGLLKEQPMHGYDLRKRLRTDFGLLSSLSFGSLYPALNRLEADGALQEQAGAQHTVPVEAVIPTGSLGGERAAFLARLAARSAARSAQSPRPGGAGTRGRKIYEVTPRGEALFGQLLGDESRREDGRTFTLRWAFAKYLSPEARLRLLGRRRRQLEDRLSAAKRAAAASTRSPDRFERSLLEHSNQVAQLDLDWIDHLIETERALQSTSNSLAKAAAETEAS